MGTFARYRRARRHGVRFESLEERRLFSCTIVQIENQLLIEGTDGDDHVEVVFDQAGLATVTCRDGSEAPSPFRGISQVIFLAREGDDSFALRGLPAASLTVRADLGGGDDTATMNLNPMRLSDDAVGEITSFFDIFTELNLGDGNNIASVVAPNPGPPEAPDPGPPDIQLRVMSGGGDDEVDLHLASFFDVFTELNLGDGNNFASVVVPNPGPPEAPLNALPAVQLRYMGGAGEDTVNVTVSSFFDVFTELNLGDGNNAASVVIPSPGPPEIPEPGPPDIQLRVISGGGDDEVDLHLASFFDIFTELNLGDGNNFASVVVPNPGPPEAPLNALPAVQLRYTGGAGEDTVNVTVSSFFDVFTELNLGDGNNVASVVIPNPGPPEAPLNALPAVQLRYTGGAGEDAIQVSIDSLFDVFLDLSLGDGRDQAIIHAAVPPPNPDFPPNPCRFDGSIDCGAGDDQVEVAASSFFDVFFDIDLGAGNDRALLTAMAPTLEPMSSEYPPNPCAIELNAREGDDIVEAMVSGFFDVFVELELAQGNDLADVRCVSGGGSPDPAGKIMNIHLAVMGGQGNDVLRGDVDGSAMSAVIIDFDGGNGVDDVAVRYREAPLARFLALPLRIHVRGGNGNDSLTLLATAFRSPSLMDLLIDGGRGRDECEAGDLVTINNCETRL